MGKCQGRSVRRKIEDYRSLLPTNHQWEEAERLKIIVHFFQQGTVIATHTAESSLLNEV